MINKIPEGWKEVKLGDVSDIVSGKAFSLSEYSETGVNLIKGDNISHNCIKEPFSKVPDYYIDLNTSISLKKGDIVFALNRPITSGKLKYSRINNNFLPAILYQRAAKVNLEGINEDYAFYKFHEVIFNYVQKKAVGSDQPFISTVDLKKEKFILPKNLEEQGRIVDVLESWDDMISALEDKCEKLSTYKKALMQKLLTPQPHWEEKKLEKVISLVIDNRGRTPPIESSGIPLVEVNAIGSRAINYNKVSKYISEETYNNWFRKYLNNGDILFSTVGQTAQCSYYDGNIKSAVAQNIVGFRFKKENQLFMYYLFSFFPVYKKFKSIEMTAVQPSIKVSQMIKLKLNIPPLPEQEEIANTLSQVDEYIDLTTQQLANYKDQKKALMQKLLTGEWRV